MSLNDTSFSLEVLPATIANGASLTDTINLFGLRLFGIVMPSSWTAASLTFQVSPDGGATWTNMYDQSGSEVAAVADVLRCIILNPLQFTSVQYIRVRSGTSSSAVTQAASRSLKLILRPV